MTDDHHNALLTIAAILAMLVAFACALHLAPTAPLQRTLHAAECGCDLCAREAWERSRAKEER